MLTKEQFLGSVEFEVALCKHAHSKLGDAHIDFRPDEHMRSVLELMQYLTRCAYLPARAIVNDDWSTVGQGLADAAAVTAEGFPAALDDELAKIRELLADLTDEELDSRIVQLPPPWGIEIQLGRALVETTLKFLAAYRLQLFSFAKQAGLTELNTCNFWVGVDGPWPPAG